MTDNERRIAEVIKSNPIPLGVATEYMMINVKQTALALHEAGFGDVRDVLEAYNKHKTEDFYGFSFITKDLWHGIKSTAEKYNKGEKKSMFDGMSDNSFESMLE